MRATWLAGNALAFDTETTGVDPSTDRLVTATAIEVGPAGAIERGHWLVYPECDIPAAATAVHGITTEKARADGVKLGDALPGIVGALRGAWGAGLPVIAMNANFDLTLLAAELARAEFTPLTMGPVLDPLVIDRAADPYRKGKRTLTALAAHYGVKQDGAHSSRGDALTAARIVWKQAYAYPGLAAMTLDEMQAFQARAHATWAEGFEAWLRAQGKDEQINRDWPTRRAA